MLLVGCFGGTVLEQRSFGRFWMKENPPRTTLYAGILAPGGCSKFEDLLAGNQV